MVSGNSLQRQALEDHTQLLTVRLSAELFSIEYLQILQVYQAILLRRTPETKPKCLSNQEWNFLKRCAFKDCYETGVSLFAGIRHGIGGGDICHNV